MACENDTNKVFFIGFGHKFCKSCYLKFIDYWKNFEGNQEYLF